MKVIYCYDALCGWCYGFAPQLQAWVQAQPSPVEVQVLSGGMVLGSRQGPIGQVAGYIRSAYRTVEQHTGVQFGQAFLQNILEPGTAYFSSMRPALALAVLRRQLPGQQLQAARHLLHMVYQHGLPPHAWESYEGMARSFGLDPAAFVAAMQGPEAERDAQADFQQVAQLGVTGFPTVLVQQPGGPLQVLARGYTRLLP